MTNHGVNPVGRRTSVVKNSYTLMILSAIYVNRGLQYFLLHIGQEFESRSLARSIVTLPRAHSSFFRKERLPGSQNLRFCRAAQPVTSLLNNKLCALARSLNRDPLSSNQTSFMKQNI